MGFWSSPVTLEKQFGEVKRSDWRGTTLPPVLVFVACALLLPFLDFRRILMGEDSGVPVLGRRPQIILLGDSITEQSFRIGGWGASLTDKYSRKADVVVRGYGGYNTRLALYLLDHIFPKTSLAPLATTVFFGANDAALLGRNNERQHVPVEEYRENLKKIVKHLKECSPNMLVILITPPPVDEDGRKEYARSIYGEKAMEHPERTNHMAGVYATKCIEVAKELNVLYVNLWQKMQLVAGWQKYLSDGLHLTQEGNAVVYQEVVKVLEDAGLVASDMQYDFPHHSQIDDWQHPEKSFQIKS